MYGKTQWQTVYIIKIHKLYLFIFLQLLKRVTTFLKKTKIHLKIMLQSRVEDIYTKWEDYNDVTRNRLKKNKSFHNFLDERLQK